MAPTDAPTGEVGTAGATTTTGAAIRATGVGQAAAGYVLESYEDTPELRFPFSAMVYDRMRKTDGQHAAVLRAVTLPIRRATWHLAGEDVNPDVVEFVAAELGLPGATGSGRNRRRGQGVSFPEVLRHALLCLPFGFSALEQVYEVGAPHPGQPAPAGLGEVAHLRKLAPRLPRTIEEVRVDADGGLAGIVQTVPGAAPDKAAGLFGGRVLIPADRLVMFTNEREGADWTGTSIFRASYKHWLIKDALLRLGPMIVERNGMGIPVVTYARGGDETKALNLARSIRAGAEAGAALEEGYKLELIGTTGATRDELPLVQYHDEAAGRAALAMFLNLGHDAGLGSGQTASTFVDYFVLSLEAVVDELAETMTEHVIRDLVELNYGTDEPYPVLTAEALSAESTPTAESLKALKEAGLLDPDETLKADVRRRYGLPIPDPIPVPPPPDPAAAPVENGPPNMTGNIPPAPGGTPPTALDLADRPVGVHEHIRAGRPVTSHQRAIPVPAAATHLAAGDELLHRATALLERVAALRATQP